MAYCQTCKTKYWCCGSPLQCKCVVKHLMDEQKDRVETERKIIEEIKIKKDKPKTGWKHIFKWVWNRDKCIICWEARFYSKNPCL